MAATEKEKAYSAKWRREHPIERAEIQRKWRAKQYPKFRELIAALKDLPCTDCGHKYPPECMDFDHVRGKKKCGIATMYGSSLSMVLAEIEKCELVCANCHRTRTKLRKDPLLK